MSGLDKILYKRLEKIREELNSYIELRLSGNETEDLAPIGTKTQKKRKNKGGVLDKFMSMKLDDEAEGGYFDDIDEYLKGPARGAKSRKRLPKQEPWQIDVPLLGASEGWAAGIIITPDSLRKDEKFPELDKVLKGKEASFSEMLFRMIDEKGLKDSDVYKSANIDRRLFSKIRGNRDYVPSKKTAISFCLALQLEMDEARKLLAAAGYAFSASLKFDLIIMYLIENREYDIHFANIVLNDYGEGTLSR